MSHRTLGQMSLADGLVRQRAGPNQTPQRLSTVIRWRPLERRLDSIYDAERGHTSYLGYKARVGMDQGSELIRPATLTSAKVADTVVAKQLLRGDEAAVHGDKGYEDRARSARWEQRAIADRIMRELRHHSRDSPRVQAARNRALAPIRSAVERKFALMKQHYGLRRVRYRGLGKNQLHLFLRCIAMNLKRADVPLAPG